MAIPQAAKRTLITNGVEEEASFGISMADSAHIMKILRDTLYTDRILAVMREYSANAWDANRMAGNGHVPIKVALPTRFMMYLKIRDFGPGLSKDDVFKVYAQYGASTKRDSNLAVGMFGIGSKSAFAYTNAFTVTSWYGGYKRVYNATLDKRDIGVMQLMVEDLSDEPNGVEVKIPVKEEDVEKFTLTAKKLYQFFDPTPEINTNIDVKIPKELKFENGFLTNKFTGDAIAVVGCIPYRISFEEMRSACEDLGVNATRIGLIFENGEVEYTANREELKYTEATRKAIKDRAEALRDEIIDKAMDELKADGMNSWKKRMTVERYGDFGMDKKLLLKRLGLESRPEVLGEENDSFCTDWRYVDPWEEAYVLIVDDKRNLKGFDYPRGAQLVRPKKNYGIDAVKAELNKALKAKGYDGIPIRLVSEFKWVKPPSKRPKALKSEKHSKKVFVFDGRYGYPNKMSDHWEVAKIEPSDDDVFVIMEKFEPQHLCGRSNGNWATELSDTIELCKLAGFPVPKIIGYKSTKKEPVFEKDCQGTIYSKWVKELDKKLNSNRKILKLGNLHAWKEKHEYLFGSNRNEFTAAKKYLEAGLLTTHPLVAYLLNIDEAQNANIPACISRFPFKGVKLEADVASEELEKMYPLFKVTKTRYIDGAESDAWLEYIRMRDETLGV